MDKMCVLSVCVHVHIHVLVSVHVCRYVFIYPCVCMPDLHNSPLNVVLGRMWPNSKMSKLEKILPFFLLNS